MKSDEKLAIWERDEPQQRRGPAPLSRRQITRAALQVADEGGLKAVTLRNVGTVCDTSAMRLYTFVNTKEELVDLLVDAVYAEMVLPRKAPTPWQNHLRWYVKTMYALVNRHPWFTEVVGGRPHVGPNALRFLEHMFSGLTQSSQFRDLDTTFHALWSLQAYVLGALRTEALESKQQSESGLSRAQWQEVLAPYLKRQLSGGTFPNVLRMVKEVRHTPEGNSSAVLRS